MRDRCLSLAELGPDLASFGRRWGKLGLDWSRMLTNFGQMWSSLAKFGKAVAGLPQACGRAAHVANQQRQIGTITKAERLRRQAQ